MEKGEDPEDSVVSVKHKNLIELLDIRRNVVMREDNALGIPRRAARKNNSCNVVERSEPFAPRKFRQASCRQHARYKHRRQLFTEARIFDDVFDVNYFSGWLNFHLFQKYPRR